MNIFPDLILVFWLVFACFWFVSAFSAKRNKKRSWLAPVFRIILAIIIIELFEEGALHGLRGHYFITTPNIFLNVIGILLCGLGIAFAILARIHLGKNWGMPMSLKEEPELVTSGPYTYVRHPIYTGVIFAMLGTTLVIGFGWLVLFVVYGTYFIYSATKEEKNMTKIFPDQYPEYKKRTKMLIPFVF